MKYAARVKGMKASEIRELLKLTQKPEIISFAGGLPSPDSFPLKKVDKLTSKVLKTHSRLALQYGPTEGLDELKDILIERMNRYGIRFDKDEILLTTGSQQVLDLTAKIFLNPEDLVAVEVPSYIGALCAFRNYQADFLPVEMDEHGMLVNDLEEKLAKNRNGNKVKLIYTVPTFQNPKGATMPLERRKKLLKLAEEYNIPILEDDPYFELRYSGERIPSIKSLDDGGNVLYTSTFSKILSPGFRLGFVIGKKETIRKMTIAKQGTDLCTSTFIQFIAKEYLDSGIVDRQIEKIREMYKRKRDLMLKALDEYFPEGAKWTKPNGGMFLWVTLPKGIDTKEMVSEAIKNKVAYVHGASFCVDGSGHNSMRLNFSNTEDELIEEGIKRLADIIKKRLK